MSITENSHDDFDKRKKSITYKVSPVNPIIHGYSFIQMLDLELSRRRLVFQKDCLPTMRYSRF